MTERDSAADGDRDELERVEAELKALLAQRDRLRARVKGSGAVAQGEGSVAAGAGGTAIARVDGDVHVHPPGDPAEPESLREAYLRWVFEQTRQLSLSGVDPEVVGREAETRLDLDALYTALLTLTPRVEDEQPETAREHPGREIQRASALELLDRHRRLVLLGDPGGGKSTFVSFVTLCLAGEGLGRQDVHLELLTAPLPESNGEDGEERQPWRHGALLPVRVVLRDVAARGLRHGGRARDLWDFVCAELDAAELGDWAPLLRRELRERGGLLLLDGLDEVPEADDCRQELCRAVTAFCESFSRCRVLVTSRVYAYQHQAWRLPGFAEGTLAPFSDGQVRRFVRRWYAHVARLQKRDTEAVRGKAGLLERAIFGSDRLRFLAARPLLLTLMASLHAWRGGTLPERRERLYADTVELLLEFWERRRLELDAEGRPVLIQPSLAEWLEVDREKVREVLEELAFDAHRRQEHFDGTADLAQGEVVSRLMRLRDRAERNPAVLVDYLSQRAGLLEPRGVGVYTFPHRTFQEYLAACHLTGESFPDEIASLARCDPERWREVALLAGAKAARGARANAWSLAHALCFCEPGDPKATGEDLWGAILAAQVLVESADLERVSERNRSAVERLRTWLLRGMRGTELPAVERALAGDCLARLGDPRFDEALWHLPKEPGLGFLKVPAGTFLMGSDPRRDANAREEEQPQHELELDTFYVARFPVTVAQFAAFVDDHGYEDHHAALEGLGNHPVVEVSWYDAVAYCEWLSGRLRELARRRGATGEETGGGDHEMWTSLAEGRLAARLPSEAEWEKAARGDDGRLYPWGDDFDAERANFEETGLGGTSTVGCFAAGASSRGCEEMSGNAWEWTRSLWGRDFFLAGCGYPYDAGDGREDTTGGAYRILRGGSFYKSVQNVRCASRLRYLPSYRWYNLGFRVVLSPFSLDSDPL